MTATTPLTFDPAWAVGDRASEALLAVDAGTMCIATTFPAEDTWLGGFDDNGPGWSGPGWGCSTTGYGDGGYDLLTVTGADGTLTGVEVMFLSPALEAAAEAADTGPVPTEAEKQAVYNRTADAATTAKYHAWLSAGQQALNAAWEQLATTIDPASESTPHPVTELTVADGGALLIGDPCYGHPSRTVPVPAGRYLVVAWTTGHTARLGAYRIR